MAMAALCVWVISIRFPRPKRQNQNSHFQADFKKKILPVHFSCVTIKYPLREVSGFDKQIPGISGPLLPNSLDLLRFEIRNIHISSRKSRTIPSRDKFRGTQNNRSTKPVFRPGLALSPGQPAQDSNGDPPGCPRIDVYDRRCIKGRPFSAVCRRRHPWRTRTRIMIFSCRSCL